MKEQDSKITIGIVSLYTRNVNCGGLLQAYAMVKALEKRNYIAKQIRFDTDVLSKKNMLRKLNRHLEWHGLSSFIKEAFEIINIAKKRKNNSTVPDFYQRIIEECRLFELEMVPHTEDIKKDNLIDLNNRFDIFIAGSDQIWNPKWIQDEYYLTFADNYKKISYAASIGRYDFSEYELNYFKKNVSKFKKISVRENNAVDFLSDLNITAKWVLDPTMLLEKKEYEKIELPLDVPKQYILCFFYNLDEWKREVALRIAQELDMKIVYPLWVPQPKVYEPNEIEENCYGIGPRQWLYLLHNASVVLTDSFHAVVFSVLYNKEFYCFPRTENNDKGNMNGRIYSLLKMLKLQNRFVEQGLPVKKSILTRKICYQEVNQILSKQREDSLRWLMNAINELCEKDV